MDTLIVHTLPAAERIAVDIIRAFDGHSCIEDGLQILYDHEHCPQCAMIVDQHHRFVFVPLTQKSINIIKAL